MKKAHHFISLLLLLISKTVLANSVCTFEDAGQRRITPGNPKDWACMKKLAEHGNVFYQFYAGAAMLHRYNADGKENFLEGIRLLKSGARATDTQIAKSINPKIGNARENAMRTLGCFYLADEDTVSHDCGSYSKDEQGNKTYQPRPNHNLKDIAQAYQWFWLWSKTYRFIDVDKEFKLLLTPQQMSDLKKTATLLLNADS